MRAKYRCLYFSSGEVPVQVESTSATTNRNHVQRSMNLIPVSSDRFVYGATPSLSPTLTISRLPSVDPVVNSFILDLSSSLG